MRQSTLREIEPGGDEVVPGVQMPVRTQLPAPLLADLLGRLSTALAAGIDLRRAWAGETARAPARWRPEMEAVAAALAGGAGLGEALSAAGPAFPPFVRGMVAVGDETGHEPETLRDVSEALRAAIRVRRALRQSLAQPAFQFTVAAAVVGLLILVAGLLRDAAGRPIDLLGSGLVGPTGLMWYIALLVAAIAIVTGVARIAASNWRAGGVVRRLVALVPVVGPAARAAEAAAWCRAASLASGAGLPAGRLMRLTALVAPGLALDPDDIEEALRGGATLADALHATGRFPRVVVEAVDVGELTGTTAETLDRLAGTLDDDARRGIAAAARGAGFLAWATVAGLIALVVFRIFSSYLGMIHDAAGGIR
ncbi:MAG: type II secretion system F family protein [Planctomycetia bacterium]